jgi:hypothetical protein
MGNFNSVCRRPLFGLLLFAAGFIFCFFSMDHSVGVYDESLILVGAARVADGAVPHRDFYANYGPAQFYILAGLFKVFGTSVLVERVWDTAIRAAVVTLAFLIVQPAAVLMEGWLAAGLVLLWLCVFGFYAFPVFPALLFSLLAVYCLLPIFEGRRSAPLLYASGLNLGITVLFRYDVGFYAVAATTMVMITYVISRPLSFGARIAELFSFLLLLSLGLATICVPVAITFTVAGAVNDFIFDILYFPSHFYPQMRGLPFPGFRALWADPLQIAIYLPIVVCIAAAFASLFNYRSRNILPVVSSARPWILLLLGTFSAFFYLKGLVRVSIIHMALSIVPALMLAATVLPYVRRSAGYRVGLPTMIICCAALIVVAVPTAISVRRDGGAIRKNIVWAAQPGTWLGATENRQNTWASCLPRPGLGRIACFGIDQEREDAVRYIKAHTSRDDAIFVGLARHDRIFVNDILFYFVAERRPATKWYHFDPGLQTSEEIQLKMIAELQAVKPPYVVVEAEWNSFDEPNGSSVSSGVTLLDDFIRANYRPVETFGTITVSRAREQGT